MNTIALFINGSSPPTPTHPPTQTSLELNPRERFQIWKRKGVQAADIACSAGVFACPHYFRRKYFFFGITPDKLAKCQISDCHNRVPNPSSLLGCYTVSIGKWLSVFGRILVPSSSPTTSVAQSWREVANDSCQIK